MPVSTGNVMSCGKSHQNTVVEKNPARVVFHGIPVQRNENISPDTDFASNFMPTDLSFKH